MRKAADYYQLALIIFGAIAAIFLGVFVYYELNPEYRLFQKKYEALESFRSTYTHKPAASFQEGVKQILIEVPDNGPSIIDRCTSCHVALDIPYFSPTKIAYDVNGQIILDEKGIPTKIPNEDYIWAKLDERILELRDEKVNTQLKEQGESAKVTERLKEAEKLLALKTVKIGEHDFDVTKALRMHPLMGRETRPFEYHPLANYGCTSCHGGNGRALTTDKAHGPVFDGQYEIEERQKPKFLETDVENDPAFSKTFNDKPGHKLIFQTTPILPGVLIEAKCMQCHQTDQKTVLNALNQAQNITDRSDAILKTMISAYDKEKQSLISFLSLRKSLVSKGLNQTIAELKNQIDNYLVPPENRNSLEAQLRFLMQSSKNNNDQENSSNVLKIIDAAISNMIGTEKLVKQLDIQFKENKKSLDEFINLFIKENRNNPDATGSLFVKANNLELEQALYQHVQDTENSFTKAVQDGKVIGSIQTDVNDLTRSYQQGEDLYIQQACYACHRISGFSRGGIGPELTAIGKNYPWYIKHHIVWPQGDLPSSTMPNFRLDHEVLEPLMTFLLGQRGQTDAVSKVDYKKAIAQWEAGRPADWEKPITPTQMFDLNYSMTVFATEGCAACHRLKGFESNVGFKIEKEQKDKISLESLYNEQSWFKKQFPEEILGSQLVSSIDKNEKEIDERIASDVRVDSIIEKIEKNYPGVIESFYTNFMFAERAKNNHYAELIKAEQNLDKKKALEDELNLYKKRLHKVLMIYIQEYGLGRLIGPKPNWSGVFRSDAWLMEHFKKPTAHVARSIMPVFPFDDTKFYALTHMLDVVSKRNLDADRKVWDNRGFNPAIAYQNYCSQCHGDYLGGNGPVTPWIYPIPKDLRNAEFLRNYTRERISDSIKHGIKGTPMPPWGEIQKEKSEFKDAKPVLTTFEIEQLTDWIFSTLPGSTIIPSSQEVPKWNYQPEDVIKELKDAGQKLEDNIQGYLYNYNQKIKGLDYVASLEPTTVIKSENKEVLEIFDIKDSRSEGPDQKSYYIKKKFYTAENLTAGQKFFNIYCATCHGAEADGMGARAEIMQDAKPRMLTNLDWLNTHDDLYLLRSIKYGVPGTSMTPWGDQTTSLLRMQLAMYIRKLSEESNDQKSVDEAVYEAFNSTILMIDEARLEEYKKIVIQQTKLKEIETKQKQLFSESDTDSKANLALEAYKQQISLKETLDQEKAKDQLFASLKILINEQKKLFVDLSKGFLAGRLGENNNQLFIQFIRSFQNRYIIKDQKLEINNLEAINGKTKLIKDKIITEFIAQINALNLNKTQLESRIYSADNDKKLKEMNADIKSLEDLKRNFELKYQESEELQKKQIELINRYNQQVK
jgi:mono/diheme cytochrome c family protein